MQAVFDNSDRGIHVYDDRKKLDSINCQKILPRWTNFNLPRYYASIKSKNHGCRDPAIDALASKAKEACMTYNNNIFNQLVI